MSITSKYDETEILEKLAEEFHELVVNKDALQAAVDSFLGNLIDELTLGIIFDLHRKYKTHAYDVEEDDEVEEDDGRGFDVFLQDLKKNHDCVCPNCDKAAAAKRFAPHLASCMGIGRNRTRTGTRRVASNNIKDRDDNPSYSGAASDDEDDIDWNSRNKRGKKKRRNGSKKAKYTPKKFNDSQGKSDSLSTSSSMGNTSMKLEGNNIECDEDILETFSNFLHEQTDSPSPPESTTCPVPKKRDKIKKKSRKDRSSPSSNISND